MAREVDEPTDSLLLDRGVARVLTRSIVRHVGRPRKRLPVDYGLRHSLTSCDDHGGARPVCRGVSLRSIVSPPGGLFCDCAVHKFVALQQAEGKRWRNRTRRRRRRRAIALDLSHLRRAFDGARVEPALSAEISPGHRSFDRLRFADPARLRQRPSAGAGRSGQGRGGDFPPRRHAGAVRRHPPRLDGHLRIDHQRHRALADGPLHRRRRRTGRAQTELQHKRHHQGISGARRLCLSAGRVASPDQGPDPLLRPRDAEVESDERLFLPPAGSRAIPRYRK